jgi:WD40 repeat protein
MTSSVSQRSAQPAPTDFFISYAIRDGHSWALWISHELERAGYRTMMQSKDFVPGSDFMALIDRGLREAAAVIAVLTPGYLNSDYGRMEWQAALRARPDYPDRKLIPVRVAQCEPEGLLAAITYLDMTGIHDAQPAREQLLSRVQHALDGRVAADGEPPFPPEAGFVQQVAPVPPAPAPSVPSPSPSAVAEAEPGAGSARVRRGRTPVFPPAGPAAAAPERVTLLHLPGPRFGRGLVRPDEPGEPGEWIARILTWLAAAQQAGAPDPDALLISGNLTENGAPRQVDAALRFLSGLSSELGLDPSRVAIVPGPHDVSLAACRAYFADCEADDVVPQPPYWPKWRHYARLFRTAYQGMESLVFDADQPWTLFELTDLRIVVAGFNSTLAMSHRREDDHGLIGDVQAAYFARALRGYERDGWLRVGLLAHGISPLERGRRSAAMFVRDAQLFDQLLGGLNLVVHGSGVRGSDLGSLAGHVPLVPPADELGPQLLELSGRGMTRWATAEGAGVATAARHEVAWRAAGATFPAARQEAVKPGGSAAGDEALEGADPLDRLGADDALEPQDERGELLDRIAQVCAVRLERANIRTFRSPEPHLRVSYADSGFVRTLVIGALTASDPAGQFDRLVQRVHAAAPTDPMEVVHELPEGGLLARLRSLAQSAGVRLRSLVDLQGLPDLGSFLSEQTARLARDKAYAADQYVPQRFRSTPEESEPVRADVVAELQRIVGEPDGRFVLLLGDFGFGKTFALRELTRRLSETPGAPLPILIDLRRLDRAHSVDGLMAAHLANHGNAVIDLRSLRYLLRQGRIVLIFDGFDELVSRISYDRAADHLERLVGAVQDDAKIIVASRTQHFRNREQVLTALGERVGLLPQRRILQLEPFAPDQVVDYLERAYGDRARASSRFGLFQQINDLSGLAANPRLLSFLAQLSPERLATLVRGREALSAADLYEEIVAYWLDFEARRTSQLPGATPGLSEPELLEAVTRLAVRLWERGEVYLRPGDIREVAATLTDVAMPMTGEETEHALGSGSLLTRTDDGLFGFIHFSVCEWLVARHIAVRLEAGEDRLLRSQRLTGLVVDFLCTLAPAGLLDAWAREAAAERPRRNGRIDPMVDNALAIGSRLNIEVSSDLSGADLSGQDLSFRRFHGVDLGGANLAGALLAGVDLSGADLSGADLTGALLRDADLTGANLTDAKLDRAQLLGTKLDGATLTRGSWDLAALIGVQRPGLAELPQLRAAAVAPPAPVQLGLAPAEVGVPFGFEIGRIPDPVSFHPHGTTLIYGGSDGGLLVCDAATGQPVRTVAGHRARVYGVRHSPDGRLLLSAGADGTARLWDADTLTELHVLRGHEGWVWPVELALDGRSAATGDATGDLRLWDTETGEATVTLHTNSTRIYAAAFRPGPDANAIATGEDDGTVRIWDTRSGAVLFERHTASGTAFRVRFSPDGRHLASAHQDGSVYEYRVERPADPPLRLEGTTKPVYCLRYHPDGGLLATGDTGGTVRLWRLAGRDGEGDAGRGGREDDPGRGTTPETETATETATETGGSASPEPRRAWTGSVWTRHTGAVYGLAFSLDGAHLASADSDGSIRLGDPARDRPQRELTGHRGSVWPMAFRLDGAMMATSSSDGTHRTWDTRTGENVSVQRGHGRRLSLARFDATGGRIVTSGTDGVARLWDTRSGRLVKQLSLPGRQLVSAFYSHGPGEGVIGSWDNGGDVHIWNPADGEYVRQILTESDHLWTGKFSPNGDVLATAEDDDTVRLRYWTTGRLIGTLAGHRGRVRGIAFSPDERWLATAADDRDVRVWELATGRCVLVLRAHRNRVFSVAWDPESRILASAAGDGTALIWDVGELCRHAAGYSDAGAAGTRTAGGDAAGDDPAGDDEHTSTAHVHTKPARVLRRGSGGRLWSVAIDPTGQLLATAGDDLAVRLWVPHTGRHLTTLLGHTRRVWSVDFSPAGDALVSSGDDGTALVWDLGPVLEHLAAGAVPGPEDFADLRTVAAVEPLDRDGGSVERVASVNAARLRASLIGMESGWIAATPDGRYKGEGDAGSEVWHVVGNCRFPLDGLSRYLSQVRRIGLDEDLDSA